MEDGKYGLSLDRNGCGGSFTIFKRNNIEITPAICTEICCDSDFSVKFVTILSEVFSYEIERNGTLSLYISGWGYIKLEKVD